MSGQFCKKGYDQNKMKQMGPSEASRSLDKQKRMLPPSAGAFE